MHICILGAIAGADRGRLTALESARRLEEIQSIRQGRWFGLDGLEVLDHGLGHIG